MPSEAKKNETFRLTAAIVGSLVIGIILGFVISQALPAKTLPDQSNQPPQTNSKINEAIFNDESALISAKVKTISPTSLTVKNNNEIEATFDLNNQTVISKQATGGNSSTKATATDIKVGEFIIINLQKVDGSYQIRSIVIPPAIGTPPSPPPIPSPKTSGN